MFFLLFGENRRLPDGRYLIRAGLAWGVSAPVLLLAGTFIANAAGLGERGLGIMSSAVSFLAALTAGFCSTRRCPAPRLVVSLFTATALVIVLLTVGFLIKGEEMNASAVLSIVSFTYAGVLSGALLQPGKRSGIKYRSTKLT